MNILRPNTVKEQAVGILRNSRQDYRKTVLLHSAISLGALMIVMILEMLISNAMDQTGGLADMGTRSILGTFKGVLSAGVNLLLPFWEVGILYTSLRVARNRDWQTNMLTRGFQRFGPILRFYVAQMLMLFIVAIACSNVAMMLTAWLPVPAELESAFAQIDLSTVTSYGELMDLIPMDQMLSYTMPMMILFAVIYGILLIHLAYRFRVSQYLLLDENKIGAFAALALSNRLTKGNKWNLLKLDLSFWWFYGLQIATVAIAYGPEILSWAGVTLPISAKAANLLFYALYAVANIALDWFAGAYVQTTYACAYEQLNAPDEIYPQIEE